MTFFYHVGVVIGILTAYLIATLFLGIIMSFEDDDMMMPWAWVNGAVAFLVLAILYMQEKGVW